MPAGMLKQNGTILDVRLSELEPLIPKCNLVLIESNDMQHIELKLVYRKTKKQMCGPDLVVQEHILLKFNLGIKELKAKR